MASVLINGYYGVHNLGDDMILNAILSSLNKTSINKIIISGAGTASEDDIRDSICVEMDKMITCLKIPGCRKWLSFFKDIDYFIFGGGGLFPEESTARLRRLLWQFRCAKLRGTKICFYGIEINPVREKKNKKLWKQIVTIVDFVVARNKQTYEMLLSFGCSKDKIIRSSDATYSCELTEDVSLHEKHSKIMLWAPNNLFRAEEMEKPDIRERYDKICRQLAETCDEYCGFYHVFLPFHPKFDIPYIKDITKQIRKSSYEIVDTEGKTPLQLRSYFSDADFCMCFRFHSVVFSLFYAKPLMAMSYSPKTSELLTELGLQDLYVEYGIRESNFFKRCFDLDHQEYNRKLRNAVEDMGNCHKREDISEQLRQAAKQAEKILFDWLG